MKKLKSFFVLAALCLGALNMSLQANTATFSGDYLHNANGYCQDGVFIGNVNHGRIKISGDNNIIYNVASMKKGWWIFYGDKLELGIARDVDKNFQVTWECEEGSTMKVHSISMQMAAYNLTSWIDCYVNIDGNEHRVGSEVTRWTTITVKNLEQATSLPFSIKQYFWSDHKSQVPTADLYPFYIQAITIDYDIVPPTPTVTPAEETISVTTDLESKQTLDVTSYFHGTNEHYTTMDYMLDAQDGGNFSGSTFYATKAGDYTVKARLGLKRDWNQSRYRYDTCHLASEWSEPLTIHVERVAPTLTLKEDRPDTAEITLDTTDPFYYDLSAVIDQHIGGDISYEIISNPGDAGYLAGENNQLFYATALGNYVLRIHSAQNDQYNATYQDLTVKVGKATPEFLINFEPSLMVGDTVKNAFSFKNYDINHLIYKVFETKSISPVQTGSLKPDTVVEGDAMANEVYAFNAGEAVMTVIQFETEVIRAGQAQYTITVNKYPNQFDVVLDNEPQKSITLLWETTVPVAISTPNTNPDNAFVLTDGEGVGTYATYDEVAGTIASSVYSGTATWYLNQAEDYKYEAAEDSFKVIVHQEESKCDVIGNMASSELTVSAFGTQVIPGYGTAGTLTFNARKQGAAWNTNLSVMEYVDGAWQRAGEEITDLESSSKTYTRTLTPTATAFRFECEEGALLAKYVKNVSLSRLTYLKPLQDTIIIYDILRDSTVSGTFDVSYSTCDPFTVSVSSTNTHLITDNFTMQENTTDTVPVVVAYKAGAEQEFGLDTVTVTIKNSSHDTSIVVIAEIVKRTRLQLAQDTALAKVDSIAKLIIGDSALVKPEVLDSLIQMVDSMKQEILNSKDIEDIKQQAEQDGKDLKQFMENERGEALAEIDKLLQDSLPIYIEPDTILLPISTELQEILDTYRDSLNNVSTLDSLHRILGDALDTITKQIQEEKKALKEAKEEAKQDIRDKKAEIIGPDLPEFMPQNWMAQLDSLTNAYIMDTIGHVDTCTTIEPAVKEVRESGLTDLDNWFLDIKQLTKDSIDHGIHLVADPLTEQMQKHLDEKKAAIDTCHNLTELMQLMGVSTEQTFEEIEVEKTELIFNEDPYDNTEVLNHYIDSTRNVTLVVHYKADTWTTLCYPFSIDDLTGTPLEGAELLAVDTTVLNHDGDTLLVAINHVTSVEAGQPYLFKPAQDMDTLRFEQVTFETAYGDTVLAGPVTFQGTLAPKDLTNRFDLTKDTTESMLLDYVGKAETDTVHIVAFRAFFSVDSLQYDNYIPVLLTELTHVQLAQNEAILLLDSMAQALIGDSALVQPEVLDSLIQMVDSMKNDIMGSEDVEEIEQKTQENKETLDQFLENERGEALAEIDQLLQDSLPIYVEPDTIMLPISTELQEILDTYRDSLNNVSTLDSLHRILGDALDTITKQIQEEKQALKEAKDEAKQDIQDKKEEVMGAQDYPELTPQAWKDQLDSLVNAYNQDTVGHIDTCTVIEPSVREVKEAGINELGNWFNDVKPAAKDSLNNAVQEAAAPMTEQVQQILTEQTTAIDTCHNLKEIMDVLTDAYNQTMEQLEKEKTELTFNEDPYDNTEVFEHYKDSVRDVTVNSFYPAEAWTTLCYPFSLNTLEGTPLENAEVVAMSTVVLNESADTLLVNVKNVTYIQAGQPYMVKPMTDIQNPKFEQVKIAVSEGATNTAGAVAFRGVLAPKDLTNDYDLTKDTTSLVLDYVHDAMDAVHMPAFRAYFTVDDTQYPDYIPVKINFDNEGTGFENIMFNADVKVVKFIYKGQLIIKQGDKFFDVQGRLIQ